MISNALGAAHIAAALVALALGLIVLLAAKGTLAHRLFGLGYVAAMIIVNVTALGLYGLNGRFGPFHALALLSLAIVAAGMLAVLRRRRNWLARHYRSMAYSYLGLWAAAIAEAVVRLKLFGPIVSARGALATGVAVAILFAAFGYLIIPRLQRAALDGSPER